MTGYKIALMVACSLFFYASYADIVKGRGGPPPDNLDAAISLEPNNADLYNMRGNNYLMSKNFDKAIQDFTKATQINPYYKEPYNGLGVAYRNLNAFDKAIDNYNKAISLDAGYFEAYNNRGVAYMLLEKHENMCSDFKRACSLGSCEKIVISRKKGLCK